MRLLSRESVSRWRASARGSMAVLCALIMLGCGKTTEPSPTASASAIPSLHGEQRTLTAVGDSLTEGLGVDPMEAYPAQLEARLQKDELNWKVINAGVSGETSSGALTRLPWILKTKPDAVILVTGANDGLRGVDPKLTQDNLKAIVSELKKNNIKVMLGGMRALPNLGEDYARKFDAVYRQVAQEEGVVLIPFFLEGVARDPALNQEDGKHPTAEGYAKVVEHIYPEVKNWLGSF